ncbi:MAG TPA: trehalose-phosphatase [Beijerinckia sp.]|jgi:trehalose 6-phosphate phosphatase|nr:trehalose-phosphatase [Beijerinckia sp.]
MLDGVSGSKPAALEKGALAQIASISLCAFFLDVDGTLLDIKPRPGDVVADAELQILLTNFRKAAGGALALVSGRMIHDLDRIFAPLIFPAAGLHGAEIRFADGARIFAKSDAMDAARPDVRQFVSRHPGLMLEDKGATLAIHFRQRPELASEVLAFLSEFGPARDLAVQEGKMVAELKQVQFDKGTALACLLAQPPFYGRKPIFIGDDLTDEAGFEFVNAAGGISIRIGTPEFLTKAQHCLESSSDLRAQLIALLA